jgi:hypothetical protein
MHPFDATMSGYNAAGGSSYVSGDNSNWGQQQGFAVGSPQQLNVMFEDKVRFGVQDNTSQPQPGFEYVFADCRVSQLPVLHKQKMSWGVQCEQSRQCFLWPLHHHNTPPCPKQQAATNSTKC